MEQEIKLLIAKAKDSVRICEARNIPKFLTFLSPAEQSEVLRSGVNEGVFFGGYDDAERRVFGVLPDYLKGDFSAFPIVALGIYYRNKAEISHRDVLGAFMSAGVKRSFVGDIIFTDKFAVAFVLEEISNYLIAEIKKIKNEGVELKILCKEELCSIASSPKTEPLSFTVSSRRLDGVLSGLAGISRSRSEELILEGLIFVNSFVANKPTKKIEVGDKITLRGVGKFVIKGVGRFSKKGREIIEAEKYI